MKHIKLPKETGENWLAALRSGEYEQWYKTLEGNGRYCCLGVLQMVVSGKVEVNRRRQVKTLPSLRWLSMNKISFFSKGGAASQTPYIAIKKSNVARLNDDGWTFPELADLLEAEMEFIDE